MRHKTPVMINSIGDELRITVLNLLPKQADVVARRIKEVLETAAQGHSNYS